MQSTKLTIYMARIMIVVCVFLIWEALTRYGFWNAPLIGQPSGIVKSLKAAFFEEGDIWRDLGWTLIATASAFTIGSLAAVLTGMLFVFIPAVESVLEPLLAALNAMPRIALAPLLVIWFGLGIGSKIAVGVSLTFFIVLQSTVAGCRAVNPDHLVLSRTLGLAPVRMFWKVTMPGAVSTMFAGLRLGLVASLLGVVASEVIASEHGLGQRVAYLAASFDINGVWAVLLVLAFIGMLLSWLLDLIEGNLLRWR